MKNRSFKNFAALGLVFGLGVWFTLPAFAEDHTQARLILSMKSARPGDTVWAGLELKMAPHWHTYWRNSGDAGLPTSMKWSLPTGVSAGEIHWPVPKKENLGAGGISLWVYIYEDEVVLLTPIKLAADVKPGPMTFSVAAQWLECEDQGVCLAGKSFLSAEVTVGGESKDSADAPLIERWRARLPAAGGAANATARWDSVEPGNTRTVIVDWKTAGPSADFYPYENQPSDVEGKTELLPGPAGHRRLRKVVRRYEGQWPERLAGILVSRGDLPEPAAIEVELPLPKPEPPHAGK